MDKTYLKALISVVDGKMTAIASDESVDRQGEKIKITAWDLENFKKNPVLQWAHKYDIPPIGRANAIRFEDIGGSTKLVFEPEFHTESDLAREVKALFEKGMLRAFSVGFIPKKMENDVIEDAELLEISAVPIPANPNALIFAKSMGMKEVLQELGSEITNDAGETLEMILIDKSMFDKVKDARDVLNGLVKEVEEFEVSEKKLNNTKVGKKMQITDEAIVRKALQKIARSSNFALSKIKKRK